MSGAWPIHPSVPDILVADMVPDDAIFVDTNILLRAAFLAKMRQHGAPFASAIVFGELLGRRPQSQWRDNVVRLLLDAGVRVVPIDVADAQWYWELTARSGLQFDKTPLCRQQEDERRCRDRLRFDLLVFAVALRHRKLLVTDNKNDFDLFPYRDHWRTRQAFAAERGWPELP